MVEIKTTEETAIVPYATTAPTIGDAILAVERWSRTVHSKQRLQLLDQLAVPERVAHLMRAMNRSLSAPDEQKDLALGRRAHELLRNAAVKSQFASFLALEGLIERLAQLARSQGTIDDTLASPNVQAQMDFNQLIAMQRSQHVQLMEVLQYIDKKKFDGLHQVVQALAAQGSEEVAKVGLEDLSKLKPASRERVSKLLGKLITALVNKKEAEMGVNQALTNATE